MTPVAPKFPNFAIQILLFRLKHTVAVVTHADVLQIFYTTWVLGIACQKQRLGPKLKGGWARGASKKIGNPYVFLQPLKLATSNLVYKCGLASSLPRNNVLDHNWWGSGLYKYCYTILLFHLKHTVAVVTHARVLQNFYTTWVRGVDCQKQRLGPKLEGGWARGASKNLGPPTYFCNR